MRLNACLTPRVLHISGTVAWEGKNHTSINIDCIIIIGSHRSSRITLLFSSSFYWNENRIVYERFQLVGKLPQ